MRLVKNPVLHFLVLGALLYWLVIDERDADIQLHHLQLESARRAMQASLDLPELSPAQRLEADLRVIEDELMYREALALGLDQGDHIVRQRLVQKLLFLAEDTTSAPPEEQELRNYHKEHGEEFVTSARVSFVHVYLREPDPNKVALIATKLRDAGLDASAKLGDRFPLQQAVTAAPLDEIGENFGAGFAEALATLTLDHWHGPLSSQFGLHFVWISERSEAGTLSFEQSRTDVETRWRQSEKRRIHRELGERLSRKYRLSLDAEAADTYVEGVAEALERLRGDQERKR